MLEFMAKAKEYENEIQMLQKDLKEYTQVEDKINVHLKKVGQWASMEQSKRSSLRKRVEQTINNLEQQKVICRKKAKIKNEEHGFRFIFGSFILICSAYKPIRKCFMISCHR